MLKEKQTIMAIKIGCKYFGLAVFKDIELIDWRIKRVTGKGMKPAQVIWKGEMITAKFFDDYRPKILVLEELNCTRGRKIGLSGRMISKISNLAKKKKIQVRFFNPSAVRCFICRGVNPTRMRTAHKIVSTFYPWLMWRYEKDIKRKWYEKTYHTILFDAVGMGIYSVCRSARKNSLVTGG